MSIDLSPAYFDLQLRFADSITQVSQLNFEEAILRFTNIYLQCLGRSFDPTHPAWRVYLEGLNQAPDQAQWTFAFYESRREPISPSPYGCFQYVYQADEQAIHFHFTNADKSGYGPLSQKRRWVRLQELQTMFAQIKQQYPDAQHVRGGSWLYNLEAYKRLFPPQYTSSMEVVDEEFQFLALWGQFLQRDGQIRPSLAHSFLSRCRQQQTLEGLTRCFPYQVLEPFCSIAVFYDFYENLSQDGE
ncbi:hypothetical protein ccbrp13_62500 [Ktedonobacteria bacterium brp13]|nr:hypothetical protein ccbrp13_62500 [Ktedonobacteria bacterium brp13]